MIQIDLNNPVASQKVDITDSLVTKEEQQKRELYVLERENAMKYFLLGFLGSCLWLVCFYYYKNSQNEKARRYARVSLGFFIGFSVLFVAVLTLCIVWVCLSTFTSVFN